MRRSKLTSNCHLFAVFIFTTPKWIDINLHFGDHSDFKGIVFDITWNLKPDIDNILSSLNGYNDDTLHYIIIELFQCGCKHTSVPAYNGCNCNVVVHQCIVIWGQPRLRIIFFLALKCTEIETGKLNICRSGLVTLSTTQTLSECCCALINPQLNLKEQGPKM